MVSLIKVMVSLSLSLFNFPERQRRSILNQDLPVNQHRMRPNRAIGNRILGDRRKAFCALLCDNQLTVSRQQDQHLSGTGMDSVPEQC